MSEIPADLKFTASHEWVQINSDGTVTVGITDFAQEALGDIVFVELPAVDDELDAEAECAVVESVKAASDIYAPISGTVAAINAALEEEPDLVNRSPYGDGWMFVLTPSDETEIENLLSAEDYQQVVDEEAH